MRNNRMKRTLTLLALSALLGACTVGPDYQRPEMELPDQWAARNATDKATAAAGERWWSLYADPVLDQLEDEALAHNLDAQVAVARVLEARAQLGITEAAQYPAVSANLSASRTQATLVGTNPYPATLPRAQNSLLATLNASYEIDLWGKFRRGTEASRAELFAAESSRDAVRLSLTTQVAQQYFALLSYAAQEVAVTSMLANLQERLAMDKKRLEVGVISEYEAHQLEADAASAQSQLASIALARNKQETSLALLLGRSPREVMSSKLEQGTPTLNEVWVPDGLPAELLLRRPDVEAAEQHLIALNARIGEARAQYFPSIGLTGYLGGQSTGLSDLFSGPAGIFQFAANVSQPIFNAGRIGYNVNATEARRDQALAQYKQAVASAFGDVRNALASQEAARQVLEAETVRSKSLFQASQQADLRYRVGGLSRFEFLDIQRNYLQAELNRIDAERAQRSAVADLFKALGGGWQESKQN